MTRLAGYAPRALSVLRIVVGLLFLEHGTQKILGFPPGERAGVGADFTLAGMSGPLELVGGVLLVLGLFTRATAFLMAGMMAVAYWAVHAPQNAYPVNNMGDAAILYCFVFLYFVFSGPGPWSLDARRKG